MQELNTKKRNATIAAEAVTKALLTVKAIVPQVERAAFGSNHTYLTECQEWTDVYYSDGALNSKKWAAFVKVAPQAAAQVQPLVDAALAAKAEYKVARDAAKVAKALRAASRAELAAYKAANGARPVVKPNSNAAANYDVLSAALVDVRALFVAGYIVHARAAFETYKAEEIARAKSQWALSYAQGLTFNEQHAEAEGKAEFDGYVAKLSEKITARIQEVLGLTGSLWQGSTLTVATDAGTQVWNTHVKHNARYGHNSANGRCTLYLQWPTRLAA